MAGEKSRVVTTREGQVQGALNEGVWSFKGIPYAKPPVGSRRWKAPEPMAPWTGVRPALEFGASPPQDRQACIDTGAGDPGKLSEDCLFLNVWTPRTEVGAKLPVVFWIHGGAFILGAGHLPAYLGGPLAAKDVVMVTFNYRLGHLGFFAHPALERESPGGPVNFGLLDQIAALEWVNRNIAQFGGDPDNVTVIGESAGAKSVLSLYASPLVKDKRYFRRGVALSSYVINELPRDEAVSRGTVFANDLGLTGDEVTPEQLRALPGDDFWMRSPGTVVTPSPVVGDPVLPRTIRAAFRDDHALRVPLMLGSTSFDSSVALAFGIDPKDIIERLGNLAALVRPYYPDVTDDEELGRRVCTDFVFTVVPRLLGDHLSRHAPVYRCFFDYTAARLRPDYPHGVPHGLDVPWFLFTEDHCPPNQGKLEEEDREFARRLQTHLLQYFRGGEPGTSDGLAWEQHSSTHDTALVLGEERLLAQPYRKDLLGLAVLAVGLGLIDNAMRPPAGRRSTPPDPYAVATFGRAGQQAQAARGGR
ncbi:carboxylesterase family protein [Myxococcus sp. K15C18031901]|uniref:carboxylesterase/lipase family protein n=1 Tax=Myxococcus dinghuensis TaxID=2906761 RepID=UPI0020A7A287|nr:carboxylesterase family protein [Myxococcus dinghuensis]MCP3098264.1 carboxylesterase family protein [Myxococcus dinghuensis]